LKDRRQRRPCAAIACNLNTSIPMSTASTAGRCAGIAFAHTRNTLALIDWAEVGQIILRGLIAVAVAVYVAGELTGRAVHAASAALGRLHVRLLHLDAMPTAQVTEQVSQVRDAQPVVISAVVLLREAGLSQRQIAETLGCSRSTVRRRLAMA